MSPQRVICVIPALVGGGAERVLTNLANCWVAEGAEVTIVTLDDGHSDPFYALDPAVGRVVIDALHDSRNIIEALSGNAKRILRLRRAIRRSRPDVVVSFLTQVNVLTLLATRGLGFPVIVSERADPSSYPIPPIWKWLRRRTYGFADHIVAQSASALAQLGNFPDDRATVIPNAVGVPELGAHSGTGARHVRTLANDRQRSIVALGRLVPEKGFDMLLDAFAPIARRHTEWRLYIYGEGPERDSLQERARSLGIERHVSLPGHIPSASAVLSEADVFVMSSRTEGFPNALGEAMACGVASISFDCPSGPRELVRDNVDGVLVPPANVPALSAAMERVIVDDALRLRLAARAPEVCQRFSLERVLADWNRVFDLVLSRVSRRRQV